MYSVEQKGKQMTSQIRKNGSRVRYSEGHKCNYSIIKSNSKFVRVSRQFMAVAVGILQKIKFNIGIHLLGESNNKQRGNKFLAVLHKVV